MHFYCFHTYFRRTHYCILDEGGGAAGYEGMVRIKEENPDSSYDPTDFMSQTSLADVQIKQEPADVQDTIGTLSTPSQAEENANAFQHIKQENTDHAETTRMGVDSLNYLQGGAQVKTEPSESVTSESADQYKIVKVRKEDGSLLFECRVCMKRHAKRSRVSTCGKFLVRNIYIYPIHFIEVGNKCCIDERRLSS